MAAIPGLRFAGLLSSSSASSDGKKETKQTKKMAMKKKKDEDKAEREKTVEKVLKEAREEEKKAKEEEKKAKEEEKKKAKEEEKRAVERAKKVREEKEEEEKKKKKLAKSNTEMEKLREEAVQRAKERIRRAQEAADAISAAPTATEEKLTVHPSTGARPKIRAQRPEPLSLTTNLAVTQAEVHREVEISAPKADPPKSAPLRTFFKGGKSVRDRVRQIQNSATAAAAAALAGPERRENVQGIKKHPMAGTIELRTLAISDPIPKPPKSQPPTPPTDAEPCSAPNMGSRVSLRSLNKPTRAPPPLPTRGTCHKGSETGREKRETEKKEEREQKEQRQTKEEEAFKPCPGPPPSSPVRPPFPFALLHMLPPTLVEKTPPPVPKRRAPEAPQIRRTPTPPSSPSDEGSITPTGEPEEGWFPPPPPPLPPNFQ
jgi:hypothetical protein